MTVQEVPQSIHAFTDDALAGHDATALAAELRQGRVSATEVLEAAKARAERVAPFLHATAAMVGTGDAPAQRNANSGLFAGVPTFIKDNTDVRGFITRHGSAAIVNGKRCSQDSPFAEQFLAQGFACLGKSTLPEFGFNATTEPAHSEPTRNPWNLAYSCGASSGGSAALVAAGVVPIAHANDGGGSIRIPAACCGLVGLKPSRGRLVDNPAAKSLPINIVSEGVVTRSVRDTANFYAEAEAWRPTSRYPMSPKLPPIGRVDAPGHQRLKIGLVLDSINGQPTDEVTRQAVETAATALAARGHDIVPMPVPVDPNFPEDFTLYWAMLASLVRGTGRWMVDASFDKRRLDGLTLGLHHMFLRRLPQLPKALWRLHRARHTYDQAMANYDAVLMPVVSHTTPKLGHLSPQVDFETLFERLNRYVGFTPLANATGAPAIALPMAKSSDNLPVSVQLMAGFGQERLLLELAFGLEETVPFPTLAPTPTTAPPLTG